MFSWRYFFMGNCFNYLEDIILCFTVLWDQQIRRTAFFCPLRREGKQCCSLLGKSPINLIAWLLGLPTAHVQEAVCTLTLIMLLLSRWCHHPGHYREHGSRVVLMRVGRTDHSCQIVMHFHYHLELKKSTRRTQTQTTVVIESSIPESLVSYNLFFLY